MDTAVTATYISPNHYAAPTGSTQIPQLKYKAEIHDYHGNELKWDADSHTASNARIINLSISVVRGANPDTGNLTIDNTDFTCKELLKMGDQIKIWLGFEEDTFTDDNYIFGGYIQKISPNLTQEIKLSVVSWEAVLNTCSLPRVTQEFSGQTPESMICTIYSSSGLGGECNTESTGLTFKKTTFKKHLVGNAINSIFGQVEGYKGKGRENEVNCNAWDTDAIGCGSCGGGVQDDGACNDCGSTNNTANNCQNSPENNPCSSGGTASNCGSCGGGSGGCGRNCKSRAGSCPGGCPISSGSPSSGGAQSAGQGGSSGTASPSGGQSGGCSGGDAGGEEGSEDITGTKSHVHWDLWMDGNKNLNFKPVTDTSVGCMPVYTYGDNLIGASGLFNEIDKYNSVDCKAAVGEGVTWEGLEVPLDPNLNLYTNNTIYLKTPMNDAKARIDKISYSLGGTMTLEAVKLGTEAEATDLPKDTDSGQCGDSSCGGGCGASTPT